MCGHGDAYVGRKCPQCSKTLKINPHLGFHVLLRKGLTVGVPTMLQNSEDKSTSGFPPSSEKGINSWSSNNAPKL